MNFNFFNFPLSQKLIHALSWTLIHSLWQGLILAVLSGIVLLMTRKAKPVLRYNLLTGLLFVFLLLSFATFRLEYEQQNGSKVKLISYNASGIYQLSDTKVNADTEIWNLSQNNHLIYILINFISDHSAVIVAIWLIIFIMKSVKAAAGLYYIHRICNYKTSEVDDSWKHRLDQLSKRLKINKKILLVESEIVNIPLVAGYLKPMILVPVGFLTNLPFSQVEAILLHELAHIKRKDYLVNLFQTFAENVFFFNPAVLWISYLIRQEREHCCDDMAIEITQNKTSFVHALVQFQEYKNAGNQLTIAFAGKRNHLLDRIKRIIYNNNKQLDAMEKLFVTASLITVTALSLAFSPSPAVEVLKPRLSSNMVKSEPFKTNILNAPANDTIPAEKKSSESSIKKIHVENNDKRYEIEEKGGKISKLKIDGQLIPEDKIESYQSEVETILKEVKERQELSVVDREKAEVFRKAADALQENAKGFAIEAEKIRKDADKFRLQSEDIRKHAEIIREDAVKQLKEVEVFHQEHNFNKNYAENSNKNEIYAKSEITKPDVNAIQKQTEVIRKQADEMRVSAEVIRKEAEKTRVEYEKMQEEFIGDLVKEGVITDKDNLSYKLNDEELIVNGVKQPEQLHSKMKARYLKDSTMELVYNWKGKTGSTTYGIIRKK